mgnify:CR=1 FL=1|tara:strand:+ start:1033 stop:1212 length:180 start_codon:yes stop_codon:yes gene_type:complete
MREMSTKFEEALKRKEAQLIELHHQVHTQNIIISKLVKAQWPNGAPLDLDMGDVVDEKC